jgi:hypothetical protein
MKDFSLEKAFMAVKAQRFEEAQGAYETALSKEATVEAWTGLGVCKIFQLLQNQTMEEVVYCFAKAKEVPGADINEIDTKLISYSSLVIEQGVAYCLSLMEQIKQAQKAATNAIVTSAISAYVASNSKSLGGTIVSSGVAAAAAGVAVGKLADINDAHTAGQLTANMVDEVEKHLTSHLIETDNTEELNKFLNRSKELQKIIEDSVAENTSSEEWYNTYWVWVWLLLFWPVGVYGLLKKYNVIK